MKQYNERLLEKYGSPEGVAAHYRQMQKKSRENYRGTGGYAAMKKNDPERFKEMSREAGVKGARIRWSKQKQDSKENL